MRSGPTPWGSERLRRYPRWTRARGSPSFHVISAHTLAELVRPLADLVTLEPSLEVVFLDAEPRPAHDARVREVWAAAAFLIPWSDERRRCEMGLDENGAATVGVTRF